MMKDIFFKLMLICSNLHDFHTDLSFLPERLMIEKLQKVVVNLHDKK